MIKKTNKQKSNIILYLFFTHLVIIIASNYLVQKGFVLFKNSLNLNTNWGTFTFPLIFLATDLTVKILGEKTARKIIFQAMFPALIASYLVSILFKDGVFTSFSNLLSLDTFIARIAIASFLAYLLGQSLDITIFSKLRNNKSWWVAPVFSTVFGSLLDTFLFYFIAFFNSTNEFMKEHWVSMSWFDYGFKLLVSLIIFIPIYGALINLIVKKTSKI